MKKYVHQERIYNITITDRRQYTENYFQTKDQGSNVASFDFLNESSLRTTR